MRISYTLYLAGALLIALSVRAQNVNLAPEPMGQKEESLGMEPNIEIAATNRQALGKMLNGILADEYVLYVKTQNYHWNIIGMSFNDLHLFFGKQYEELACIVDMVAERGRMLGVRAIGTMQEMLAQSHLKEEAGVVPDAKQMLKNLLNDHEALIRQLRADVDAAMQLKDAGTNNFLTDLMSKHEKMAWMLRSYIS